MSTKIILHQFMLDARTLRSDLRALEDGVRVFDMELKFDITHDKWKHCMTYSKHPIVLNLDMAEVVAMTVGLAEAAKSGTLFAPQFAKIACEIYSNLSEYAKGKILRLMKEKNLSFNDSEVSKYEQTISNSILTMWKSGCAGTIQVCLGGTDYVYTMCRVIDCHNDIVRIFTSNKKEVELHFSDIFSCEYEMPREYC